MVNNFFLKIEYIASSLVEIEVTLPLKKLEYSSPKNALCQVWLKLALKFWRGRFCKIRLMYFSYFVIITT